MKKRQYTKKKKIVFSNESQDIPYKKYRVEWVDCISDSAWASEKEFQKMKLAKPVNEGWIFSKDKHSIKMFASYDKDEDGITFGDRTMIPRSWIVKITKI
jgi:DNA-dependent RNA polymerase auxiliary subunit epsilon